MMKNLYGDVIPPPFVHCIGGGEEGVVIPDRRVGHIVKVGAPRFRPRAAQLPGCDADLPFVRADDRFERDTCGAWRVPACGYIVEARERGARVEPVRTSFAGASKFALCLVADIW